MCSALRIHTFGFLFLDTLIRYLLYARAHEARKMNKIALSLGKRMSSRWRMKRVTVIKITPIITVCFTHTLPYIISRTPTASKDNYWFSFADEKSEAGKLNNLPRPEDALSHETKI